MMNYKTIPYKHQKDGSDLLIENPVFCLGDEMGTGKTKLMIDAQCYLNEQKIIEAVIVVCPNSVKMNYANPEAGQLVTHGWGNLHHQIYMIKTGMKFHPVENFPKGIMHWIIVNYESVWRVKTEAWLKAFMQRFNTTMVLDESHKIKDYTSAQAKGCHRLAPFAKRRVIMSGTLVTTNPLNYWSQFKFLDVNILGFKTYTNMRIEHAEMVEKTVKPNTPQERTFKIDVGYKNTDNILKKIAPFYRRVEKKDCLDLPPKVYKSYEVEMTAEQVELYNSMKTKMVAEYLGMKFKAPIALTKLIRLLQISSGYISQDNVVQYLKSSPKVNLAVDLLDNHDGKSVVFFREHAELKMLVDALLAKNIPFTTFHGKMSTEDREASKEEFQKGDKFKVSLTQVAAGGIGIDYTAADLALYISNSNQWVHRKQSEDRLHRPGQYKSCLYVDVLSTNEGKQTFDHQVLMALKNTENLVDLVVKNQDDLEEFLRSL